ncbi:MAG: SGNH/GDSL hydrolase family protein [Flavobacteriales bacterium]|nr:SGNH/GDSL hydrolase family protein [Flavobacteriales bacterium]MCB9205106.1 SGNH/GDSL hydrolase family protein [Flavobacteriales bacterium]
MKLYLQSFLVSLLTFIIFGEIALRCLGWYSTYLERSGSWVNQVSSPVNGSRPIGSFHIWAKNTSVPFETNEFQYVYNINRWGVRESKDLFLGPKDSLFRILTLGDSFTEGVGADYAFSWPRVLEDYLNDMGVSVEVFNAGVSGSDIWYSYVLLRDKLVTLNPDLVVVSLNTSDLSDYILRGGMERFQSGEQVLFRQLPWWEPFYRVSHVVRAMAQLLGYNYLLIKEVSVPEYLNTFEQDVLAVCQEFRDLALAHGFKIFFVAHPVPAQLRYGRSSGLYDYRTMESVSVKWQFHGYKSADLWVEMNKRIGADSTFTYSWPIDGHLMRTVIG